MILSKNLLLPLPAYTLKFNCLMLWEWSIQHHHVRSHLRANCIYTQDLPRRKTTLYFQGCFLTQQLCNENSSPTAPGFNLHPGPIAWGTSCQWFGFRTLCRNRVYFCATNISMNHMNLRSHFMNFLEQTTLYHSEIKPNSSTERRQIQNLHYKCTYALNLFPTAILTHKHQGAMLRETMTVTGCCTWHLVLVLQMATKCPLVEDTTISKPQ